MASTVVIWGRVAVTLGACVMDDMPSVLVRPDRLEIIVVADM
jgi:hypothetical protein